ncbi:hypothetical protein [Bittarella massiliensis (ex Durand et al. 2017)]|uniref:hypothetical protein n=1 Tax=Bittarella massiliensis (ex Durand et al. 2017) TaxID=1720313 RepID=UPI00073F1BB1|nr:hypothetical protein [Bittarella massiliensis (ex Durand et al. 2017)]
MVTEEPTKETTAQWRALWEGYRDRLRPDRASGRALLGYLQGRYELTEMFDGWAAGSVTGSVLGNACCREKLPAAARPAARTFYLENSGARKTLCEGESGDSAPEGRVGGRIFVGVNTVIGLFTVEGSTLLWEELCAVRELDEEDIQNFVSAAQYVAARERPGRPVRVRLPAPFPRLPFVL